MLSSSILTRLQSQHHSLAEIIDGLPDTELRKAIQTGKWSVFENIVHLATYQHTFIARLKQLLEGNNPSFGRYSAETDPLFHDNCTRPTGEIMQDLLLAREEIIASVTAFSESDLGKTGAHPVFGRLTITDWLHFFLLHEAHHLFTIFKLTSELKKGISMNRDSNIF